MIGGTSAHLAAVVQGLVKVIAGIEISFTSTSKSAAGDDEDDEFADLYVVKWTSLMLLPVIIMLVNLLALAGHLIVSYHNGVGYLAGFLGPGTSLSFCQGIDVQEEEEDTYQCFCLVWTYGDHHIRPFFGWQWIPQMTTARFQLP